MDTNLHKTKLKELYKKWMNREAEAINGLPLSGSSRLYFRLTDGETTVMGAYNADIRENEAFFSFTQTFIENNIDVPQIFVVDESRQYYLLQDLGSLTAADFLKKADTASKKQTLETILSELVKIQTSAGVKLDYTKCYPRERFDAQSIQWDLNYFKYEFLKLVDVPFDEQKLEDDFNALVDVLNNVESEFFMYRDFQLRNILWSGNKPWFIDYQGGRKGPLQYDVASLIYSPTTRLTDAEKEYFLQFYINELQKVKSIDPSKFEKDYYLVALVRVMQALGAYGYRGLFQQKPGFAASIKAGILNFIALLDKVTSIELPELLKIGNWLNQSELAKEYVLPEQKLTIKIMSFSYKRGIPSDPSQNGGGFVFDCRGIPNPGRYAEYKKQSGLDVPVISYLEEFDEVHQFAENLKSVVEIPLKNYIERGFAHLCIYFGCTGGQHRSVYNAERLARWIKETYPTQTNVVIDHRERQHWNP